MPLGSHSHVVNKFVKFSPQTLSRSSEYRIYFILLELPGQILDLKVIPVIDFPSVQVCRHFQKESEKYNPRITQFMCMCKSG
ncbi:unnamed protein product [Acanthoscelides obtectus]|uniref:Uncharacterized protein n=1 Tax=Acanthoscelides obtectus TaxID=200917 RepID=A0A9P0JJB5_ACAOB|nr:unnamed protein product [Acanthoscelides obtectus]CAK1624976.1 hypothetical protein AOBTE_LOCUS2880 [Acanthoscelides obtectus]